MGSCCTTNNIPETESNKTHKSDDSLRAPEDGSQWMCLTGRPTPVDNRRGLRSASSTSQLDTNDMTLVYTVPSKQFKTKDDIIKAHGYDMLGLISSGHFASVYKARRVKDGQLVACKVLDLSTGTTIIKMELFVMERTRHPNIVRLFEHYMVRTGDHKRLVYIWMQFASLDSLSKYVREAPDPLTEPVAQRLFVQIVAGVRHMHLKGFAHRDLKMGNVLLGDNLSVMISDFGLSCVAYRESRGGTVMSTTFCGTIPYMAPEVLLNTHNRLNPYNPFVADIWSLGIVLYCMVNKAYPFNEDRGFDLMIKNQLKSNWRYSRFVKTQLSNGLTKLLKQLLEPECRKRITIAQLANHQWISHYLKDIPV